MQDRNYTPLDLLRDGESGEVMDVLGDPEWVSRMNEVGICVGRQVRVLRQGSPCLLEVEGARLSVRGESVRQIFVSVSLNND